LSWIYFFYISAFILLVQVTPILNEIVSLMIEEKNLLSERTLRYVFSDKSIRFSKVLFKIF
jgi:hypothetical protein